MKKQTKELPEGAYCVEFDEGGQCIEFKIDDRTVITMKLDQLQEVDAVTFWNKFKTNLSSAWEEFARSNTGFRFGNEREVEQAKQFLQTKTTEIYGNNVRINF